MRFKVCLVIPVLLTFILSGCFLDNSNSGDPVDSNEGGISGSGGPVDGNEGGISGSGGVPTLPNLEVIDPGSAPLEFNKRFREKFKKSYKLQKGTTKENFTHGRSLFDSIELKLYDGLRDVASLLSGAYDIDPVEINEFEFHWNYQVDLSGEAFDVILTSIVKKNNVEWNMVVISNSVSQVLLTGTSTFKGDSGTWRITNLNSSSIVGSVLITWQETEEEFKTYYTIIDESSENIKDFAEFSLKGDDAHLVYFDFSIESVIELKWDTVLESGSVVDPIYKNGLENFWDTEKFDLDVDSF